MKSALYPKDIMKTLFLKPKPRAKRRLSGARCSVSAAEVEKILKNTDWNKFWEDVHKACEPELEAYRRAAARSAARAAMHWFT